jgi:hypothetical protein
MAEADGLVKAAGVVLLLGLWLRVSQFSRLIDGWKYRDNSNAGDKSAEMRAKSKIEMRSDHKFE